MSATAMVLPRDPAAEAAETGGQLVLTLPTLLGAPPAAAVTGPSAARLRTEAGLVLLTEDGRVLRQ